MSDAVKFEFRVKEAPINTDWPVADEVKKRSDEHGLHLRLTEKLEDYQLGFLTLSNACVRIRRLERENNRLSDLVDKLTERLNDLEVKVDNKTVIDQRAINFN